MNITGSAYRPFYPQDSISFATNVDVPYNNSETRFYIASNSGDSQIFALVSGAILSPSDSIIGSFRAKELLYISGNLNKKSSDLYLNEKPLYLGLPINGNQNFTGIKVKNFNSGSIDINYLYINGNNIPSFSYTKSQKFPNVFSTGAIQIVNNGNSPFVIFSGSSSNSLFKISGGFPLVNIPAKSTGLLYIANATDIVYTNTYQSVTLNLDTNIGNVNVDTEFLPVNLDKNNAYLSLSPQVGSIKSGQANNYVLSITNPYLSNVSISLSYKSGYIGNVYDPVFLTQLYTETVTGAISGVGRLSSFLSSSGPSNGNIPYYSISRFNSATNTISYAPASGFVYTDVITAASAPVTGRFDCVASGLTNISANTTGNAMGKIYLSTGYSGYIDFITGGVLTGTFAVNSNASNSYFGYNFTGKLNSTLLDYITYIPNNVITLKAPLTNRTQYNSQILSKTIYAYITGNFSLPWVSTGIAFITGAKSNPSAVFATNVSISGNYNFNIPDESYGGKYNLTNEQIIQLVQKNSKLICSKSDLNVSQGEVVFSALNQYCTGYLTKTFYPTGKAIGSADFTGFFYNPVVTGVYFNKTFSGAATGGAGSLVPIVVTGSVYSFNGAIILDKYNLIYAPPKFTKINYQKSVTGYMQVVTNNSILTNKLVYSSITGSFTGVSTNGYYSVIKSGTKSSYSNCILPAYAIGDDGKSKFYFINTSSFYKANDFMTGTYSASAASIITGAFLASGNLSGQLYNYIAYRKYSDIWSISTGYDFSSLQNLSQVNDNTYSGTIIPKTTLPNSLQISVSYDNNYGIINNISNINDSVVLTVTGKNFIGNNSVTGYSILIQATQ
jgi:hypothetical protein